MGGAEAHLVEDRRNAAADRRTPASKMLSLGARFKGKREGKSGGGSGLQIGQERERFNGLNRTN